VVQAYCRTGYASAQGNLGTRYAFGQGVLKDYVYAQMWGDIAAANGNKKSAKLRDFVEKNHDPIPTGNRTETCP